MLTQATGRFLRVSPRKVRQVLRLIQGLEVPRAEAVLGQVNRRSTLLIRRVLKTAVASAAQKAQVGPEALRITKAVADEGPMWKRHRAGSMGRAMMIRKRTCHLRIELDAVSLIGKTSAGTSSAAKASAGRASAGKRHP